MGFFFCDCSSRLPAFPLCLWLVISKLNTSISFSRRLFLAPTSYIFPKRFRKPCPLFLGSFSHSCCFGAHEPSCIPKQWGSKGFSSHLALLQLFNFCFLRLLTDTRRLLLAGLSFSLPSRLFWLRCKIKKKKKDGLNWELRYLLVVFDVASVTKYGSYAVSKTVQSQTS